MTRRFLPPGLKRLVALLAILCIPAGAARADKNTPPKRRGTVSGIVLDKRAGTIQVKLDGQEKPVTYAVDRSNKALARALAGIFTVGRVRLAYETVGDQQKLVGIRKTGTMGAGTVTGVVLATHGWWVAVKPRNGPPDGYAATFPAAVWKATEEKIKTLRKGDTVVISYYTDFERHRIRSIRKVGK